MVRSALPSSSSPSRAFDVALFVCWIIHACQRHLLHVAFIVGVLVASIELPRGLAIGSGRVWLPIPARSGGTQRLILSRYSGQHSSVQALRRRPRRHRGPCTQSRGRSDQ